MNSAQLSTQVSTVLDANGKLKGNYSFSFDYDWTVNRTYTDPAWGICEFSIGIDSCQDR
jgi:hypothetical protein